MSRLIGISLALTMTVACGATPRQAPAAPEPAPVRDRVYAQDGEIVKVVDVATGATLRAFSVGATAPDWSAHHAVEPTHDGTAVRTIDPRTGKELRPALTLPGSYYLPSLYGPAPSGLSPRGDRLVLAGFPSDGKSRFSVIDTTRRREMARVEIVGHFTFDAISDLTGSLYFIQHPAPDSTAYNVRLYDLRTRTLLERPVVDQKLPAEPTAQDIARGLMDGLYHSSVAGRDGGWYFSLYFHPKNGPFIHALNLDAQYASCILDLPKVMTDRGLWGIGLTPNGKALYAVNGATGHVVGIDPKTLQVTRRARLGLGPASGDTAERRGGLAFSPDGARLYAVGATGIVVANLGDLTLRAHHLASERFDGVALSPDGARLYALRSQAGEVWQIEASTGRLLRALNGFAAPRAILRVESD